MTLPLRVYKTVNNLQLLFSIYASVWLVQFFTSSISCNMIENRISTEPYLLRYGNYFIPSCSPGSLGLTIGLWDSLLLRLVFISWIVISLFVYLRIRRIRTYVAVSEPVEFIKKKKNKKSDKNEDPEGEGDKDGLSLISDFAEMFPKFQLSRIMRLIISVTSIWIILLLLLQGPIVEYFNRYAEEKRFNGEIQEFRVRFSKDGVANISLFVDGNPILLRSDKNLLNNTVTGQGKNGAFEGFETYILDDPLLPTCLEGAKVDVFARRQGVYYTLDGSDHYYIRFIGGSPSCQETYINKCVFGGDSIPVGQTISFEDENVVCRCNIDGLSCLGSVVSTEDLDQNVCEYFGELYESGSEFLSQDSCNNCVCDNGVISCTSLECPATSYDLTNSLQIPIYYWFVDEPEPSDVVNITAGRSDEYNVVAYKPFGQSPKTELTLANGRATLIFSTIYSQGVVEAVEVTPLIGNERFPDLARYYSSAIGGYAYGEIIESSQCGQDIPSGSTCLRKEVGGLFIECTSKDKEYDICDAVMSTYSVE